MISKLGHNVSLGTDSREGWHTYAVQFYCTAVPGTWNHATSPSDELFDQRFDQVDNK